MTSSVYYQNSQASIFYILSEKDLSFQFKLILKMRIRDLCK